MKLPHAISWSLWAVVRFPYEISCLLALVPKHGGFQIVGVWGVGGDAKACMRGMNSGELGVLPPSFLAHSPVNELCLLFWPNPYATSCFVLHTFFV